MIGRITSVPDPSVWSVGAGDADGVGAAVGCGVALGLGGVLGDAVTVGAGVSGVLSATATVNDHVPRASSPSSAEIVVHCT
jgi:hypothetical protein